MDSQSFSTLFCLDIDDYSEFIPFEEEPNNTPKVEEKLMKFTRTVKSKVQTLRQTFQPKRKRRLIKEILNLAEENGQLLSENEDLKRTVDSQEKVNLCLDEDLQTQKGQSETEIYVMDELLKSQREFCEKDILSLAEDLKLLEEKYEAEMSLLQEELCDSEQRNQRLRMELHELQATESCRCNYCQTNEVKMQKQTIRDLEEKLRLQKEESDLLRAKNQELEAANTCHIQNENVDLKSTNQELVAAKTSLENEIVFLSQLLETQRISFQDQEEKCRLQKEEAEAEIMQLKTAYDRLQTNLSKAEQEILQDFEDLEDKLMAQITINCDNAAMISKLTSERNIFLNKISALEDQLRIQTEKTNTCARENAAHAQCETEILQILEEVEDQLTAQITINFDYAEKVSQLQSENANLLRTHQREIGFLTKDAEKYKNTIVHLKTKLRIQKEDDGTKIIKLKMANDELQENFANFESQVMAAQEEVQNEQVSREQKIKNNAEEILSLKNKISTLEDQLKIQN